MKKGSLIVTCCAALIAGCANESPLMFVSKTTIGVEVAAPYAGGSEANFSIGFKALDTAYVPVVEIVESGKTLHIVSSSDLTESSPHQPEQAKAKDDNKPAEAKDDKQSKGATVTDTSLFLTQSMSTLAKQISETTQTLGTATGAEKAYQLAKLENETAALGTVSRAYESLPGRRDALSVFSVIDSNSMARADGAGVGVGKIFATGLAAQKIAENYRTPHSACTSDIVRASVALQQSEVADQKALGLALASICPKK